MLCAFDKLSSLERCIATIERSESRIISDQTSFSFFKASRTGSRGTGQGENGVDVDVDSDRQAVEFFVMLIPKQKVGLSQDIRSLSDLFDDFPKVDKSVVEKVWNSQQTWSACCDVLSSLVTSNHRALVEDCSFIFDDEAFPRLGMQQYLSIAGSGSSTPVTCASICSGDWSIVEIGSSMGGLTIQPATAEPTPHDALESWEVISQADSIAGKRNFCSISGGDGDAAPSPVSTKTYKDVLLQESDSAAGSCHGPQHTVQNNTVTRDAWQPAMIVVAAPAQRRHLHKRYQCDIEDVQIGSEALAISSDEDSCDFLAVQYDFAKGRAAAARSRTIATQRPLSTQQRNATKLAALY